MPDEPPDSEQARLAERVAASHSASTYARARHAEISEEIAVNVEKAQRMRAQAERIREEARRDPP